MNDRWEPTSTSVWPRPPEFCAGALPGPNDNEEAEFPRRSRNVILGKGVAPTSFSFQSKAELLPPKKDKVFSSGGVPSHKSFYCSSNRKLNIVHMGGGEQPVHSLAEDALGRRRTSSPMAVYLVATQSEYF